MEELDYKKYLPTMRIVANAIGVPVDAMIAAAAVVSFIVFITYREVME